MKPLFKTSAEFETLFKEYFGPLCNYVNIHIKDWEESREIVQTTFTKIWNNRDRLEVHTSAQSYLYQASKNTMIDVIRKRSKLTEEAKSGYYDKFYDENNDGKLDSFKIKEEIVRALDKLKPKNKKIFQLNKFEGLTYKEIAAHMDISERSVEDNIARAIKFLREELKGNENIFVPTCGFEKNQRLI